MILTRVRGLPQSIEIDRRPDKKFRLGFIGAPAAAGLGEKTSKFPLLAPWGEGGVSWFLIWGSGGRGG